jgi:asparagine synthase (glutamine-hydrolysing)
MCGIAGIFRRRSPHPSDPGRLQAMADSLVHRGPDDYGYLLLDSRSGRFTLGQDPSLGPPSDVLFGNRRLSIVDRSPAGRQPMTNEARNVFLVFNGEVYNYLELRRDLVARGHRFASESDTEVVVHAYEEWGPDCVRRFNGMWAFALWDQPRRRLLCSRDRFGTKPFYYFLDGGVFVFGSEIKAILEFFDRRAVPHWPTVLAFLTPGALCHTEDTFFDRIRRLPAAHNLLISDGEAETARYWTYTDQSHAYDYRQPEATFAELFDDAVGLRLRTDVPAGVALSGGVDSTSVTTAARRHLGGATLKVFNAEFPGAKFDERRYAELAANHVGAELYTTAYEPTSLVEDLRRVIWHMDYPALEAQVLPRWRLMSLAARHVRIVLEGQGSDEMLAGYPYRYFPHHLLDELGGLTLRGLGRRQWNLAVATMRMARGLEVSRLPRIVGRVCPRLKRLSRWMRAQDGIVSRELRELVPWSPTELPLQGPFSDRLTNALYADHARNILPHLLKFGDAISMAHSLEARLPFLDHRLVEFVFQLTPHHKFEGTESKLVLKHALKDVLPSQILGRTDKVGFATPIGHWLRAVMDREVRPLLLSEEARTRHVFDRARLEDTLRRLAAGYTDLGTLVFRWLSLELWFRLFIDDAGFPRPGRPMTHTVSHGVVGRGSRPTPWPPQGT